MVVATSLSSRKYKCSIGGDGGHEPEFTQIKMQHWW